jgi:hypothetical protein
MSGSTGNRRCSVRHHAPESSRSSSAPRDRGRPTTRATPVRQPRPPTTSKPRRAHATAIERRYRREATRPLSTSDRRPEYERVPPPQVCAFRATVTSEFPQGRSSADRRKLTSAINTATALCARERPGAPANSWGTHRAAPLFLRAVRFYHVCDATRSRLAVSAHRRR